MNPVLDWLKKELDEKEQEIKTQQDKIDTAIENKKPHDLISSYKEEKSRLVEEKKELRQRLLNALHAEQAGQAGECLPSHDNRSASELAPIA